MQQCFNLDSYSLPSSSWSIRSVIESFRDRQYERILLRSKGFAVPTYLLLSRNRSNELHKWFSVVGVRMSSTSIDLFMNDFVDDKVLGEDLVFFLRSFPSFRSSVSSFSFWLVGFSLFGISLSSKLLFFVVCCLVITSSWSCSTSSSSPVTVSFTLDLSLVGSGPLPNFSG